MKLYELQGVFAAWDAALESQGGEITDEQMWELDRLEADEADKIEAVASMIASAKAESAFFDEELARLQSRRNAARNKAERLTGYLSLYLDSRGLDSYQTKRFKVRRQKNSVPTVRWLGEEGAIPHPYRVTRVELNKAEAARDFKAGVEMPPGLVVEYGTHLRIA